jgi:hypothetical protein
MRVAYRPLGSINRLRHRLYQQLGEWRHQNHATAEHNPVRLEEVPDRHGPPSPAAEPGKTDFMQVAAVQYNAVRRRSGPLRSDAYATFAPHEQSKFASCVFDSPSKDHPARSIIVA